MSSLRKNVASQHIGFALNAKADGTPVTAGGAGTVVIDNGAQAACAGTFTHKGTGQWDYAPTQAETNGASIGFAFTGTGAIQVGMQFFTIGYDPATDLGAIKTQTDKLTFTVANQVDSNVLDWKSATAPAMTGDAFARLGAPIAADISHDIAGVQTDTTNIKTRIPAALVGGRIDASIGAVAAGAITAAAFAAAALDAVWSTAARLLTAGTNIVLAKGVGLTGLNDLSSVNVTTAATAATPTIAGYTGNTPQTGDAFSRLGAAGAGLTALGDARVANLDATVSSRLAASGYTAPDNTDILAIKAKTDNLPATPADESLIIAATNSLASAIAALPNAAAIASAVMASVVETGLSLVQYCRLSASALFGKASGMGGSTATFRDMADTKNRITATVDTSGDRTAIALDAS
jgi:hypothetical protein